MRLILSFLLIFLVSFSFSYAKSEQYYYQKLEKKCKKLEKIVKPIALRKKYAEICDIAKYCFNKFALHVCDEDFFASGGVCRVGSLACLDTGMAWPSWDKYGLGNCACNGYVEELKIIDAPFTFY